MGFYFTKPKSDTNSGSSKQFKNAKDLLDFLSEFGLHKAPVDLPKIYQLIGPKLRFEAMDNDISGKLEKRNGNWCAYINSLHSENRQNFTMAHELGHYLLHVESATEDAFVDTTFFRDQGGVGTPSDYLIKEVEANKFAADLLMPADDFKNFVKFTSNKVADIAQHFKVSPQAVKIRAKNLKA